MLPIKQHLVVLAYGILIYLKLPLSLLVMLLILLFRLITTLNVACVKVLFCEIFLHAIALTFIAN